MQLMGQCVSRKDHHHHDHQQQDYDHHDQKKKVIKASELERINGCLGMVEEQRSRFYIARKCVVMLLCWPKYSKYY